MLPSNTTVHFPVIFYSENVKPGVFQFYNWNMFTTCNMWDFNIVWVVGLKACISTYFPLHLWLLLRLFPAKMVQLGAVRAIAPAASAKDEGSGSWCSPGRDCWAQVRWVAGVWNLACDPASLEFGKTPSCLILTNHPKARSCSIFSIHGYWLELGET